MPACYAVKDEIKKKEIRRNSIDRDSKEISTKKEDKEIKKCARTQYTHTHTLTELLRWQVLAHFAAHWTAVP